MSEQMIKESGDEESGGDSRLTKIIAAVLLIALGVAASLFFYTLWWGLNVEKALTP